MAVDLATSGSLGYGIGLQAKVPDKTNLVFQLENQRLKRKALENEAQEAEQQRAAKQEQMFQKAINVDATKWHRTLVGKVNQAANDAVNEYSKLYAENPRVAQNSINQIMRKFNEQVSTLSTTNEQRKQMQKDINSKIIKGQQLIGDEDEFYNYLLYGNDLDLPESFTTSLGEYTINPDSTMAINAIGGSNANENAQKSADSGQYGTTEYRVTPLGVEQYRAYSDDDVKKYMSDFYAASNGKAKIADIAINKQKLKAAFDASGLAQTGMTFRQFTDLSPNADPRASQIVDKVLLDYHKGLLNNYSPKPQQTKINPVDELGSLANQLDLPKQEFVNGEWVYTTREITPDTIESTWNNYKNTSLGKIVIALSGGEKSAKDMYEKFVKPKQTGMRQKYQGGAGATKGFELTTSVVEAPEQIMDSRKVDDVRNFIAGDLEKKQQSGKAATEAQLTQQAAADLVLGSRIEIKAGDNKISLDPTATNKLKGSGWSTGAKGYANMTGDFRYIVEDKNGTPKGIVVQESNKDGSLGDIYIVPYELNKDRVSSFYTPKKKQTAVSTNKQVVAPVSQTTTTSKQLSISDPTFNFEDKKRYANYGFTNVNELVSADDLRNFEGKSPEEKRKYASELYNKKYFPVVKDLPPALQVSAGDFNFVSENPYPSLMVAAGLITPDEKRKLYTKENGTSLRGYKVSDTDKQAIINAYNKDPKGFLDAFDAEKKRSLSGSRGATSSKIAEWNERVDEIRKEADNYISAPKKTNTASPAKAKTTVAKKYYTKQGQEVDVTGFSNDQINKAIKDKLIFAK